MFLLLFIRFEEAEDDCTEALNLDDRYIKAYSRRATARKELGKLKASMEGFELALFYAQYIKINFYFSNHFGGMNFCAIKYIADCRL